MLQHVENAAVTKPIQRLSSIGSFSPSCFVYPKNENSTNNDPKRSLRITQHRTTTKNSKNISFEREKRHLVFNQGQSPRIVSCDVVLFFLKKNFSRSIDEQEKHRATMSDGKPKPKPIRRFIPSSRFGIGAIIFYSLRSFVEDFSSLMIIIEK